MKRCPQCGKQYASEANFCPVDAGRLEDVPDNAPVETDEHVLGGRFVVGDPIGGGLTGQVFKATDKESGHPCVVKWVDPAVFSSPLQMQRTERELKQLERQQAAGIARVLGHGRKDDRLWIASEYVAGTPLNQLLESVGPLPLERATKIVHDVGVALAEAAKLGVIHRDVAPKNVLVGDGDEVHVINFGVAVPATPSVRGTPEFVAPEQVDGKPVDQRSNIYSLGAMLFTLVTGRPPFEGDPESVHNAHLHSPPPHASESQNLDTRAADVDKLLDRALAKQSSKRFMTLRQLLAEMERLAGIEPASTQRMSSTRNAEKANGAADKTVQGKKKKKKNDDEAHQTLLGVAAFERPKDAGASQSAGQAVAAAAAASDEAATNQLPTAPTLASGGVVAEVAQDTSSGVAALAPPVTQPPPISGGHGDAVSMPALTPAGQVQTEDPGDAAETNAMHSAEQHAALPEVAEPQSQPAYQPEPEQHAEPQPQAQAEPAQPEPSPLAQAQAQAEADLRVTTPSGPASGKRRKRKKKKKTSDNKFRETMWFKKGELDEAAAEAAAAASRSEMASARADELPEDERYKDDGTLSAEDQERLSLRTGHTQMMEAMDDRRTGTSGKVEAISDEELAREMTGGNKRLLIAGGVLLLLIVAIVIIVLLTGK